MSKFSQAHRTCLHFDPEVIEKPIGELTNGSGEGYAYPQLKTTTFGLNVTF